MNDDVYFWHADKQRSLLQVDTIILGGVTRYAPKVPKIRSLHIFSTSPEKHGDEVDFLPADKYESFLQDDSNTLGACSQACPMYPKQQVCNIFATSHRKREGRS